MQLDCAELLAIWFDRARLFFPISERAGLRVVGIHRGGVWLAKQLHRELGLADDIGQLDIGFHRDDFDTHGIQHESRPSQLPFGVDDAEILLVDDVLHTGRTIRAAMNEIFDYGRPRRIVLAVLLSRPGRQLPIEADIVGHRLEHDVPVKLRGPEPLRWEVLT